MILGRDRVWSITMALLALLSALGVSAQEAENVKLRLGGALRFGYKYAAWSEDHKREGGLLVYDVFRLNPEASYGNFSLTADYRFYATASGGGMLKYGYMSYTPNERHQVQLGLVPVPFGVMPCASNSFLFNLNYLLGLEDDSDMGLRYVYNYRGWEASVAFYKNADWFGGEEASPSRFGFDVAGRNREVNQLNLYLHRQWGNTWQHQIGLSSMVGGLYNIDTQAMGSRYATALHYTLDYGALSFKAQYSRYGMYSRPKQGLSTDYVIMTAFGTTHLIASEGDTYSAGLGYRLPFRLPWLSELYLYNDFSMMHKRLDGAHNTYQNILGCLITTGPIQTYVDWALARNHPDMGLGNAEGFVRGLPNQPWQSYLYINLGYYF